MLPPFGKAQKIKAKEKLILWKKQQAEKKAYEEQKEQDRLRTIKNAIELREKRAEVSVKPFQHPSCLKFCACQKITLNIVFHNKTKQISLQRVHSSIIT